MKSARNIQDLASDVVRWQENKYALRQQQQQQFDAAIGYLNQGFEKRVQEIIRALQSHLV